MNLWRLSRDSSITYVSWHVEKLQNNNDKYFCFVGSFYCTSGMKIDALIFLSLTLQKSDSSPKYRMSADPWTWLGFEMSGQITQTARAAVLKGMWFSAPFMAALQRCWSWSTLKGPWATSSRWRWGMWWKTSPRPARRDGCWVNWMEKGAFSLPTL